MGCKIAAGTALSHHQPPTHKKHGNYGHSTNFHLSPTLTVITDTWQKHYTAYITKGIFI